MANIRRGYSDDFVIKNNKVGIGASNPQENLDVVGGALQGQDLKVTGVSTQTGFSGFLRADHQIAENIEFSNINVSSLSGEIIVGTGVTVTIARVGLGTTMVGVGTHTIENTIDTTDITTAGGSQIDTLKVYNTFTPPSGDTNQRPYAPKPGELYYNYDFKTIEFFDGYGWRQVDNTTRSGRAVFGKGGNPNTLQPYQYLNINTRGRSEYFGESTNSNYISCNACGDGIRGLWGGNISANQDVIEYITMASAGNAIDFGNLTDGRDSGSSTSSSTRGLWSAGIDRVPATSGSNVIDYVEIQTLGNALDFGDLFFTSTSSNGVVSSGIRGFFQGGGYPAANNGINMVTIASKGDAIDFGDLSYYAGYKGGFSSSVRAVIGGGMAVYPATPTDQQDTYIMASAGTVTNFGNLTVARHSPGGASTHVRGIYAGGSAPNDGTALAVVDSVIIASDGTAEDYAELSTPLTFGGGVSDSHGGLGGF